MWTASFGSVADRILLLPAQPLPNPFSALFHSSVRGGAGIEEGPVPPNSESEEEDDILQGNEDEDDDRDEEDEGEDEEGDRENDDWEEGEDWAKDIPYDT